MTIPQLQDFRGDIEWVHAREGHWGKPYWPGGNSGITFDPGVDLGHADSELIESAYAPLLSTKQKMASVAVYGIKGRAAFEVLNRDKVLGGIKISKTQAIEIFPAVVLPYWNAIKKRFPALKRKTTPSSVQTVLLSLAYNRGPNNRGMNSLEQPLHNKEWEKVARIIGNMQQRHRLRGIRRRRKLEAALIKKQLRNDSPCQK